jgi:MFS family permease
MDARQVGDGVRELSKSRLPEEAEDNFLRSTGAQSPEHADVVALASANDRLAWPLVAHALLRVAGSTSGILIGLYLAALSQSGVPLSAGLVGTLGAVSFAAELFASVPMGVASDALSARRLMTAGAIGGGFATILFAVSRSPSIFFVSRLLEGASAAAIVPALLAFLTDATEGDSARRARIMSFFELTLLVGLALGGVLAAQLFRTLHAGAFAVVSVLYLVCGAILYRSVRGGTVGHLQNPLDDLRQVVRLPSLRQLAPVWLCVNAVVGLWLSSTLYSWFLNRHCILRKTIQSFPPTQFLLSGQFCLS